MKFASLGSGSEGNALLVSSSLEEGATVMVDCGFPVGETERRLGRLGLAPADIAGIFITHEHQDHVGGAFRLARRYGIPVWLTHGTYQAVRRNTDGVDVRLCRDGDRIAVRSLVMHPYTVPHDAREPVQYVASDQRHRLGILTDAGQPTPHLIEALAACDGLLLECNHDLEMLAHSSYPASLKARIGSAYGHLSNESSAAILKAIDAQRLRIVVGAHLSQKTNTPAIVERVLREAVEGREEKIDVRIACQHDGFDWIELSAA